MSVNEEVRHFCKEVEDLLHQDLKKNPCMFYRHADRLELEYLHLIELYDCDELDRAYDDLIQFQQNIPFRTVDPPVPILQNNVPVPTKLAVLLGSGASGDVYEVPMVGTAVAVKVFKNHAVCEKEARTSTQLRHPNIMLCYGLKQGIDLMMVSELGDTSLADACKFFGKGSSCAFFPKVIRWLCQSACGLEYMHSKGFIHTDVKAQNVIIKGGNALIADFGTCVCKSNQTKQMSGTLYHIAPEVWKSKGKEYDEKRDIYSFAMMMMEVASDQPLRTVFSDTIEKFSKELSLFCENNNIIVRKRVRDELMRDILPFALNELSFRPDTSLLRNNSFSAITENNEYVQQVMSETKEAFIQLIEKCWSANPADRPPMGKVKNLLKEIFVMSLVSKESDDPRSQTAYNIWMTEFKNDLVDKVPRNRIVTVLHERDLIVPRRCSIPDFVTPRQLQVFLMCSKVWPDSYPDYFVGMMNEVCAQRILSAKRYDCYLIRCDPSTSFRTPFVIQVNIKSGDYHGNYGLVVNLIVHGNTQRFSCDLSRVGHESGIVKGSIDDIIEEMKKIPSCSQLIAYDGECGEISY